MCLGVAANDEIAATQQLFNQDKEYLKAFTSFPAA